MMTAITADADRTPLSSAAAIPEIKIFGLRFNPVSLEDAVAALGRAVENRERTQVNFANAQTVALARRDGFITDLLNRSRFTFPDGMSIVWGGRMLGHRIPERVAGPDLMAALCQRAATRGWKIFLLGSCPENLERLASQLMAASPTLQIVGKMSPPVREQFNAQESMDMVSAVNASGADILFVGISCPKQERWIDAHLAELKTPLNLGVGAAFDFLSGRIPRAPEWLQVRGLEWLYRLWCEPRRLWRRYLWGNLVFLSLLSAERIRRTLR